MNAIVKPIEEVNLNAQSFFDPESDNIFETQFLVTLTYNGRDAKFLCRQIDINQIDGAMSIDDLARLMELTKRNRELDDLDRKEVIELNRLARQYDIAAIRSGVVEPKLSDAQLENLPYRVSAALSTAIFRGPETEEEVEETPDNEEE